MGALMIRGGELRDVLSFRRPTKVKTTAGGADIQAPLSAQYAELHCRVEPIRGREIAQGGVVLGEATHRIHLLFYPDILHDDVAVLGTRVFEFVYIENVEEMDRELMILAKVRLN